MTQPSGLTYHPNLITENEEQELLENIYKQQWDTTLNRRTIHLGYRYEYSKNATLAEADPIPDWLKPLLERIEKLTNYHYDQIIINEYLPKQKISQHIDHTKYFGNTIVSVSLGVDCPMQFSTLTDDYEQMLERRSAVVLRGDARYRYKHALTNSTTSTRVSLTFRKVIV